MPAICANCGDKMTFDDSDKTKGVAFLLIPGICHVCTEPFFNEQGQQVCRDCSREISIACNFCSNPIHAICISDQGTCPEGKGCNIRHFPFEEFFSTTG